jgi:hypothetical protein
MWGQDRVYLMLVIQILREFASKYILHHSF